MDPKHKALSGLKITDAAEGKVSAVFATLNVKDSDGDVTLPGAFKSEPVRISAYNHESWKGALPVGKGTIREDGDRAVFEGQFFLDTTSGRDTFEVVKQMGALQEWSYGYDVLDSEKGTKDGEDVQFLKSMKVHEVSPVLLGAGVDTHTIEAKGLKLKLADHLDAAVAANEEVTKRIADAVAQRAEKNQALAEETQDKVKALVDSFEVGATRLREALAIEPPNETTEPDLEGLRLIQLGQIRDELAA